jgi:cytochrome b561
MIPSALRNSADRYGTVARALHWSMGLLLIAQVVGAVWVFEFMARSAERAALIGVHKALGVVLLILALLRLAWRAFDPAPALPGSIDSRLQRFARLGHGALYALMVLLPIGGILIGAYAERPTDVFGLFTIPAFMAPDEAMHELFEDAHKYGGYALGVLILGHLAVALHHKYVRKDGVADRML